MIKINRTKLIPKLLIFLTLGLIILSFSTTVQGRGATIIRPIDDYAGEYVAFLDIVDLPGSFLAWADPDSGLCIYPHAVEWVGPFAGPIPVFNFLAWEYKVLGQCPHGGCIQETEIDEESTLISINLHVKEVPFLLFNWYVSGPYPFWYNYEPISAGTMNYNFQCKILFNTEMLNDWFEKWGRLPSIFEIIHVFPNPDFPPTPSDIPVITFMHITAEGYLTEGGEGTVKVNQVAILDLDTGDYKWPVEIIIVE
ncbi:MAG: hypothetical protein JSV23_03405 [Promethearchaeota archaeon]|nr:MAG: hypothetical protein JSV23_03405 [Candidatus Lokiarchaeota archaeon]